MDSVLQVNFPWEDRLIIFHIF